MRSTVAKSLRGDAQRLTVGNMAASELPRDGWPSWRQKPFAHGDQTTRATYRRLKRFYREMRRAA